MCTGALSPINGSVETRNGCPAAWRSGIPDGSFPDQKKLRAVIGAPRKDPHPRVSAQSQYRTRIPIPKPLFQPPPVAQVSCQQIHDSGRTAFRLPFRKQGTSTPPPHFKNPEFFCTGSTGCYLLTPLPKPFSPKVAIIVLGFLLMFPSYLASYALSTVSQGRDSSSRPWLQPYDSSRASSSHMARFSEMPKASSNSGGSTRAAVVELPMPSKVPSAPLSQIPAKLMPPS